MIDLDKFLMGILVLLICAMIGFDLLDRLDQQPDPEPVVEYHCEVVAIHPGVDGGKVMTVVCPKEAK
jgi:hypothetical protein